MKKLLDEYNILLNHFNYITDNEEIDEIIYKMNDILGKIDSFFKESKINKAHNEICLFKGDNQYE